MHFRQWKRREFITLLGGAAAAWPLAARAQQTTMPVIGFLRSSSIDRSTHLVTAFRQGLKEAGYSEGQNVAIEYRSAEGQYASKRLGLLHELAPNATTIVLLNNPTSTANERHLQDVQSAARNLGKQIRVLNAVNEGEIDAAFLAIARERPDALIVGADAFFVSRREQIVALSNHYKLPAFYIYREFAEAGGLMSYGPSHTEPYRLVGIYTGRILKGAKPAELPVIQSTKFELVINLKTAKALGLEVPPMLLARADEVIE
jgi:putative ABC transport system substrate-binding protein